MKLQTFTHGDRTFTWTADLSMTIPKSVIKSMLDTLDIWVRIHPIEPIYPQTHWGVPSILVRFDGVLSENKAEFLSYEIESCPAGMAYGALVSPSFKENLERFRDRLWPKFALIAGPTRQGHEDGLWLPEISLSAARESDTPVLIRDGMSRRTQEFKDAYGYLTSRSMMPMWYRAAKSYGVALGWWKEVEYTPDVALPWDDAFVIKPSAGTHGTDVLAWGPGLKGKATRSQIMAALQKNGRMYVQPFIPPMHVDLSGEPYHAMLRPYFAFNPQNRTWEPIGGMWVARPAPNLRLHWTSDSISGPLVVEAT